MMFLAAFISYFVIVLTMALLWNIVLFKSQYNAIAENLLREPPLFISGISAIVLQGMAFVFAFHLFYPKGTMDISTGILLGLLMSVGTVTYGMLVVPGKFKVKNVGRWVLLEAAYGLTVAILVSIALTLIWGSMS